MSLDRIGDLLGMSSAELESLTEGDWAGLWGQMGGMPNAGQAQSFGRQFAQVSGVDSISRISVADRNEAITRARTSSGPQTSGPPRSGVRSTGYTEHTARIPRDAQIVRASGRTDTAGALEDRLRGLRERDPRAFQEWLDENPGFAMRGDQLHMVMPGMGASSGSSSSLAAPSSIRAGRVSAPGSSGGGGDAGISSLLGRLNGTNMGILGFLTGGVTGAISGYIGGSMMQNLMAGSSGRGGSGGGGISAMTLAGGMTGNSGIGWGMGSIGMSMLGAGGMEFQMRKQMRAAAADMQDDMMIGMINNKGIPIESLIMMFMAYMSNKYEDRLREKMEEAARVEKMERRHEQLRDRNQMISGIASAVGMINPVVGAVAMAGNQAFQTGTQFQMQLESAMEGGGKSSTILMSEVQMLMHKWKQLTEMLSNMQKSLHDMAMTIIRNQKV